MTSSLRLSERQKGLVLAAAATLVGLLALELGYRLLDPFPYISEREANANEHGNLSQYDPELGWSGVPHGRGRLVTLNAAVVLQHNAQGMRDVDHGPRPTRPAIVLLGDSFAWGYEVEAADMLLERLRLALPGRELYAIAHRGWGTDQELLALRRFAPAAPLERVVLLVSPNDVDDNASVRRYEKAKPRFELRAGELALTNSPVPPEPWPAEAPAAGPDGPSWRGLLFRSHLAHDVAFRLETLGAAPPRPRRRTADPEALALTSRLIEAVRDEARARGASLLVAVVPAKEELLSAAAPQPHRQAAGQACARLGLPCLDLTAALRASWRRTYHRRGAHWNAHGHAVAAEALLAALGGR